MTHTDKSGGDALQTNLGEQGAGSFQDTNAVGAGGAGIVDGFGGSAAAAGAGNQFTGQNQDQENRASTGHAGNDNVYSDSNINV